MSTPILSFDAVRKCESEIWRSLAGVMQMTLEHWTGSEIVRRALERVYAVIADQLERTANKKGGEPWTH
jgi:hypothetical protein